jgi:M-phase inducer tyrosine phosphatase
MSTSQLIPQRRENQLPPFTFGAGIPTQTTTQTMTIDEAFTESPSQTRNMFTNPVVSIPRPRFATSHSNVMSRGTGSPFTKKPSAPAPAIGRPRKQFRRTLSMFEHPADIMKAEKKETTLDVVMDVDEVYQMKIPHFVTEEPNSLPRINQDTMIQLLNGDYKQQYDNIMVIDCRFEYEYRGGHIDGAFNFNDRESLARHLFDASTNNTLLVFHCEYSAHRAPRMAQYIREQDRSVNAAQYPKLSFPEMYILDGGYSAFFENHRSRCYPQNYVEMEAKEHELACERGLGKVRQRSKLSRAVTYAFGQHNPEAQNSPSRPGSSSKCGMDTDLFVPRMHPRRSASN